VLTKYNGIPVLKGIVDDRPVTKQPWYDPIVERATPDWEAWGRGEAEKDFATWIKVMKDSQ